MLTGDAEDAARRVSETLGLDEYHARLLPDEKLQKLEQIRSRSGAVMFVGDGINDAPFWRARMWARLWAAARMRPSKRPMWCL